MADGFFRSKKGFTVVQNDIVRDVTVSLKAKGLYLMIQSNITREDVKWKKDDFMAMCLEGEKAFNSAWDELKEKGFLKIHMYPNGHSSGNKFSVEYELLDAPATGAHTYYYNAKGELSMTNLERKKPTGLPKKEMEEITPKVEEENLRYPHFGSNANGSTADGMVANGMTAEGSTANGGNNINTTINPFIKTGGKSYISNHSIIQIENERKNEMPVVYIDLSEQFGLEEEEQIMAEVLETSGITDAYRSNPEKLKRVLQVLTGWMQIANNPVVDEDYRATYYILLTALYEMIMDEELHAYGNDKDISYKHVVQRINGCVILDKNSRVPLANYMSSATDHFLEASRVTEITFPVQYAKRILWESFKNYRIEWQKKLYNAH